jgi:hypothetical protein
MSRRLGLKVREVEAAGNLARIELEAGNPELGRRLMEENLEPAREVGFTWWVAGMLIGLAEHSLQIGDIDDVEARATEALELDWELTDRAACLFALALLAVAGARRGDRDRAGILWGAIEAEERKGPVGHGWDAERADYEAHLASAAGENFERARAEGGLLGFEEAVEFALAGRNQPTLSSR